MIEQLERLSSEEELKRFQEKYPFVDAHEESIEEWFDYPIEELDILPFRAEFTEEEVVRIRHFIKFLELEVAAVKDDWVAIRRNAAELLEVLRKT